MSDLTFAKYQRATLDTAIYPRAGEQRLEGVVYCALGLAGEAGEIANKAKKILRDDHGAISTQRRADILSEAQDCLWYLARLVDELEGDLDALAMLNIMKLADRKERGVIGGSGDDR